MATTTKPDWIDKELERLDGVVAAQTSASSSARAVAATYARGMVVVSLSNGASFAFPPHLAQGLAQASTKDLSQIEISPLGTGLHWPKLDADFTVAGLLAGVFGSKAWMREHAARAGRVRSPAKAAAARANGALGGRPRKAAVASV